MNPINIPMEDDLLHTSESPFCYDETLIGEVAAQVEAGILTPDEATNIVNGKGL